MNKQDKIALSPYKKFGLLYVKGRKYLGLLVILFFAIIYLFILLRINGFMTLQPSASEVNANLKTSVSPDINPAIVNQLEKLQNNSVSVQALFDQARQNPFQ